MTDIHSFGHPDAAGLLLLRHHIEHRLCLDHIPDCFGFSLSLSLSSPPCVCFRCFCGRVGRCSHCSARYDEKGRKEGQDDIFFFFLVLLLLRLIGIVVVVVVVGSCKSFSRLTPALLHISSSSFFWSGSCNAIDYTLGDVYFFRRYCLTSQRTCNTNINSFRIP